MKRVLVLGATGMLGAMVADLLSREKDFQVQATARPGDERPMGVATLPFDADLDPGSVDGLVARGFHWIVNAIGIIKPYIKDGDPVGTERAVRVNALFPHVLARSAARHGARVIQIATDCVYSGRTGGYQEDAPHDALDAYGKTKSLGEVCDPGMHHLRCSIIGPERKAHVSLLDWFLSQPKEARLTGYANHVWNGVTTFHFARICRGIILEDPALPHLQHVVPTGLVSKADMLEGFAEAYGRQDLHIARGQAATVIDRTLGTADGALNRQLWRWAGYDTPPDFHQMLAELAAHRFRRNGSEGEPK